MNNLLETPMTKLSEELSPRKRIIAMDFDGTLVDNQYPDIGFIREDMWAAATKVMEDPNQILILWSSRTGEELEAAVKFCEAHGLTFEYVNENAQQTKDEWGGDTRKIFANLYIDDRAGLLNEDGSFRRVVL